MMIWFAGILQNTCCNKTNQNKTNKKLWVVSVVSFTQQCDTITRVDYRVISYKY